MKRQPNCGCLGEVHYRAGSPCQPCKVPILGKFFHCHTHCWRDWEELVKRRKLLERPLWDPWKFKVSFAEYEAYPICECPAEAMKDNPAIPENLP